MRIVVTGGAGFIGEATVRAARTAGHDVSAFDRQHGDDILGDLTPLRQADAVIHLAGMLGTAELFDTPERAVEVNILGTLRVLQACERGGCRYVGITMPEVFPSVYTATKIAAARLATAWHHRGVPVAHVRAFNAYGPGQKHGPGHPQKIIPMFASSGWRNEPIPIWGDGEQTVDLVHVEYLARMLVDATRFGHDEVFDGGTGVALTVNQVAERVLAITGSTAGVRYLPMRAGEVPTRVVATGEGWSKLGWKPQFRLVPLHDAVESYRP